MSDEAPIRIVSGDPTDEETAAVAALFTHLRFERAISTAALPEAPTRSTWERRSRAVRITPEPGRRWQDR